MEEVGGSRNPKRNEDIVAFKSTKVTEVEIVFERLEDEQFVKLVKLLRLLEEFKLFPKMLVVSKKP